jgi:exodeoxyribonuclease V beta subunit
MSQPLPELVAELPAFDIRGPLPAGTTLLEASAGTGKTYTVAGLVTRYVAEGVARLDELLVVTFGRAASQELRERVREALVGAEAALADPTGADRSDPVVDLLLSRPDLAAARGRLRDALADFDAATIATTHQFCQLVLRSLGVAGDSDPGATLVESLDELAEEVVDDLYLARYAASPRPPLRHDEARALARDVIADPQAALVPDGLDPTGAAGARVELAHAVRAELERRKRRLGILSYDDLLSQLAGALEDPAAPARDRMRGRWRVVLVDEFQDTDPVQWQVIERAFDGHATIVLIGDPKQAIYAFRGGDVVAYLQAAGTAATRATLADNHRADPALVRSLQRMLVGAELGDPRIRVHPVTPARRSERLRLPDGSTPPPWRIRVLERTPDTVGSSGDLIPVGQARSLVAADCAADIARLLGSGATWDGAPIAAHHVAVLVHERGPVPTLQRELAAYRIHSVVAGGGDILHTSAAAEWLALLTALDQPHRTALVRAAGLSSFVGLRAGDLDAGGDGLTDRIADTLRGWAMLWRSGGGVAAVLEAAEHHAGGLGPRVLAEVGGERLLTDLRHVGQVLHETAIRQRFGPAALLAWLHEARRRESGGAERTRRLDSDAAAVQIVTIHGSKGLQYPVVYLPFEFEVFTPTQPRVQLLHDSTGRRCLDVSGAGQAWQEHLAIGRREDAGERLRMLYVALTRAQSQVVCWWAATHNTAASGLHRLLLGRAVGDAAVPEVAPIGSDAVTITTLRSLAAVGGPHCEPARLQRPDPPTGPAAAGPWQVRSFARTVDTDWRRTSYSGLIRAEQEQAGVRSEPETGVLDDEPALDEATPQGLMGGPTEGSASAEGAGDAAVTDPAATDPAEVKSPMAALPSGAAFGSLVHAVLEHADPQAPDLLEELRAHTAEQLRWWPVGADADEIAAALLPALHTPLGPLAPGLTLAQLPLRDRLRELDFEFPLAGGDSAVSGGAEVRLGEVAELLRRHLPTTDPMRRYAARLASPALGEQPLRGYLSGSIDALLRVPGPLTGSSGPAGTTGHGPTRFLVVDYKTNLLGDPARPTTAADYGPTQLAEAMLHSHYPLQALLYSVVAQRFLRWRVPGYDPEQQWGGVLYLFLRGMCGPDTPVLQGHPTGVFGWRPPVALVTDLSDLLDGRYAAPGPTETGGAQ